MPEINALEKISNAYYLLTAAEKKVADYVIAHQRESQYMSITELAEACGVAEATISRFAKRLDYKGYNAFKLAVAHSTAGRSSSGNPLSGEVLKEDSVANMCQKLFAANVDAMEQTLGLLQPEAVTAAGNLLAESGNFTGTVNANGGGNIPLAVGAATDTGAVNRLYAAGMAATGLCCSPHCHDFCSGRSFFRSLPPGFGNMPNSSPPGGQRTGGKTSLTDAAARKNLSAIFII